VAAVTSPDERRAAYQRLEDAITECARIDGAHGVITDWVALYATQDYTQDGTSRAQVGRLVPNEAGGAQYYRLLGLLDYAQARARAEVAQL
jgi:hypothetical protein